jgi:ABC-type branched-subunit amino acid transport system substrate-binding protein
MMSDFPKFLAKILLTTLSTALLSNEGAPQHRQEFQIAALIPLTGKDSEAGKKYELGLKIALNELKKQKSKNFELEIIDTKSDSTETLRLYHQKHEEKANLIISPFSGWNFTQIYELSKTLKQPTLNLQSSLSLIEKSSPYLYHFSTQGNRYPQAMAIFAKQRLHSKFVVCLSEIGNESSFKNAQIFEESWKKIKGEKISQERFSPTLPLDLTALITKAKKERWQHVYLSDSASLSAQVIKAFADAGLKLLFLGSPEWSQNGFFQNPGEHLVGHFFPIDYTYDNPSLYNKEFLYRYKEQLNSMPHPGIELALAYDSLLWIDTAITNDKNNWWIKLLKLKNLNFLTQGMFFNEHFNIERRLNVISTQQKDFRFQSEI